jgi:glycosyltransferase involved in cell wall biosynthesis
MPSHARTPVTVFVQAYNTAGYVGECLESVFGQRGFEDFEVLVIDDASTDGTPDEIARFADPRLRAIRHDRNLGAIATANEGYAAAAGRLVVRIDSDDRLRPGFLARAVPLFAQYPRVGLVYGDIVTIDERGRVTSAGGMVNRKGQHEHGDELFALLQENYIPAPCTVVRREALAGLLPIPSELSFVDWYITTGIAEQWETCFVSEVLAEYRVHRENMHRAMILDRRGEASSRRILDALFSRPVRQAEKRRWRRRVYARHYLTYAEKYFGCDMTRDARRCYWEAIRRRPAVLRERGIARRFAATWVGQRSYDALKGVVLHQGRRVR